MSPHPRIPPNWLPPVLIEEQGYVTITRRLGGRYSTMSESTNESPHEQSGVAELTESDWHRLQSNDRRRVLLDVLEGRATPVKLYDVAAEIVEDEANNGGSASDQRDQVAIALHHKHLPQMTEMGLIDYDPESHSIRTV